MSASVKNTRTFITRFYLGTMAWFGLAAQKERKKKLVLCNLEIKAAEIKDQKGNSKGILRETKFYWAREM